MSSSIRARSGSRRCRAAVMLGLALVAAFLLGGTRPASAHPGDEAMVYHYLWLEAEPGKLALQHATQVGGLLTQAVWSELDRDGNGQLSAAEQERHARLLARDLRLEVDGKSVRAELSAYEYPSKAQFLGGDFAPIKLRLTAPLPKVGAAGRKVTIRDRTFPEYTGSFPMPYVYPTRLSAGEAEMSEDGRTTAVMLGPPGATLTPGRPAQPGAGTTERLPGLSLDPERGDTAGTSRSPAGDPRGGRPSLEGTDLADAPIFPERGQVLVARPHPQDGDETHGLKGLLGKPLSPWMVVLGLGAALVAGAAHALTPGHGKAVVGAYLVGSRGTVWDAVLLGITVAVTHTLSVYILGALCLWLTTRIQAAIVAQWLGAASGALVLIMGFWLFQRGLLAYHGIRPLPGHTHAEGHGHSHGHAHSHAHEHALSAGHEHSQAHQRGHAHQHAHASAASAVLDRGTAGDRRPPRDAPLDDYARDGAATGSRAPGRWGVIGLGVAGGMVPCTDALVILLAAVNLGSIAAGLAIIAAFSVGMAAVLVAIGVLMVTAKDFMRRFTGESAWVRALPAVSGAILLFLGVWLTLQSLAQIGVLRIG